PLLTCGRLSKMGEEMDKPKEKDKDPKKDVEKEIPKETKAKDGKEADTPKDSKLNQKNESKPCELDFDCPAYPVKYSEGRIGRESLRLSDDRKRLTHGSIVKSPVGSYVVERTLGTGAFEHVYKVSSLNNKYEVYAMKTELDQKEKLTNLRVELEVLKDVNDENHKYRQYFTKLIDRGRTNTFKFLIMELVSHTLQDIFTVMCKREMPLPSAAYAADRCAIAIDALHHRGFIHRHQTAQLRRWPRSLAVSNLHFRIRNRKKIQGRKQEHYHSRGQESAIRGHSQVLLATLPRRAHSDEKRRSGELGVYVCGVVQRGKSELGPNANSRRSCSLTISIASKLLLPSFHL
ncbi:hypothetical protein PRIPAC_71778, partial [Pristionchus pacificus]